MMCDHLDPKERTMRNIIVWADIPVIEYPTLKGVELRL